MWYFLAGPQPVLRVCLYNASFICYYLLLSLLPHLAQQVYSVNGMTSKINYGLDRCRFITPVPGDAYIRASFTLVEVLHKPKGIQLTVDDELQIRDHDKPAVVARTLALLMP